MDIDACSRMYAVCITATIPENQHSRNWQFQFSIIAVNVKAILCGDCQPLPFKWFGHWWPHKRIIIGFVSMTN